MRLLRLHVACTEAGAGLKATPAGSSASQASSSRTNFGFQRGFHDDYVVGERLGAGGFGVVSLATNKQTGERYAVKTLPKRFGPEGTLAADFARRVRNEVDVYSHLGRSLNVAYLYAAYEDDACVDLVQELCEGGQLWERIRRGSYSEADAVVLVREVMRTLAQCHAKGIAMRDVKPENFLFLHRGRHAPLKAVDFGSAAFLPPGEWLRDRAGTIIYLAPEVARQKYCLKADVWSAGVVAYLLLAGRLPFAGEDGQHVSDMYMSTGRIPSTKEVFRAVLYAPLDFETHPWDSLSPAARDFVSMLLERDASARPTAEAALRHPWLDASSSPAEARPLADTIVQRLQWFGTFGHFKQSVLRVVARNMAQRGMPAAVGAAPFADELSALWAALPGSDSGRVQFAALLKGLTSGRFQLSTGELAQLVDQFQVDAAGWVDYDNWLAALVDWRQVEESLGWDSWVAAAFQQLDSDGDAALSRADLEAMLCPGEDGCATPDFIDAALREGDRDNDGRIGLQDFQSLLHTGSYDDLDLFETRLVADREHMPQQPSAVEQQD